MKDRLLLVSARALERSPDGARLRRRIGAIGGLSLLVVAMLSAIGLGMLVLAVLAVAAAGGTIVGVTTALRRSDAQHRLGPLVRAAAREAAARLAVGTRAIARRVPTELPKRSQAATAGPREALRLNALGVELRRAGQPEQAVECHRAALVILEQAGERRDVALTQNNLALALERAGDEEAAIAHFEEAIWILRSLGEEEREGQVIANLGAAQLRRGHAEEASELFQSALEKLEPQSHAHDVVVRQLARTG